MLYKLIIVRETGQVEVDWNLYRPYPYNEYYLCDIDNKKAIIFKNKARKSPCGGVNDEFQVDENFNFENLMSGLKREVGQSEKWQNWYKEKYEKASDIEKHLLEHQKPYSTKVLCVKDIEVDEDFINSVTEHQENYQKEKRRFEDKIRNLFENF